MQGVTPTETVVPEGSQPDQLAQTLLRLVIEWGTRIVGVAVLIIAAWFVAGWARRAIYRALNKPRFDQTLVRFASNMARWAILAMGVVAALTIFGIAPTSLAAVVGAVGVTVGLALQGSLSNLAAGLMLMVLRPFKVGELITVSGQAGLVDEIELFYTKLDTPDKRRILLPNGVVFGAVIENVSHHPSRRCEVQVAVSIEHPIEETRRVLLEAATSVEGVQADPAPEAALLDFAPGGQGVTWSVRAWVPSKDFGGLRQQLVERVKTRLGEEGMNAPAQLTHMRMLNQ